MLSMLTPHEKTIPIPGFLDASRCALRGDAMQWGEGFSTNIWRNHDDEVRYDNTKNHTLSFYLRGGEGTYRLDQGRVSGWKGALCVLPEGHRSEWKITQPFEFIHLYMDDRHLKRHFSHIFDQDCRILEVMDRTYFTDPILADAMMQIHYATMEQDVLLFESHLIEIIHHFLKTNQTVMPKTSMRLQGGLSPRALRLLDDFMQAHLDDKITLEDLAQLLDLSPFHLQRNFTRSRGMSPQEWLTHMRIDHAKSLIRQGEPLSQITYACGFTSQGHLNRRFKQATGLTPGAYKKML